MPVTYIYRIALFDAYTYGLVGEGRPRPDDPDAEGTLYQIITTDDRGRLVKLERFFEGEPSTERTFFYEGDKPAREEEFYTDTGTRSEIRYRYRPGGLTKEFLTDGELDHTEEYSLNEKGVVVGCRQCDALGEETASWEANERGDRVRASDGEQEVSFDHRYDDDGLLVETSSRAGERTTRETYRYRDNVLVKHEVFSLGPPATADGENDEFESPESETGETLVSEESVEVDPDGKWEVRRRRQLVSRIGMHDAGQNKYWPSRIEILFDDQRRITDVLACDYEFLAPALGVNCEANAYYFFEYED